MREGEDGRQWDFPMQQWKQKSEPVLFKIGILHNLDSSFIVSPLWWPNLDWQVAKERGLLERLFTWDTLGLILFTLGETKCYLKWYKDKEQNKHDMQGLKTKNDFVRTKNKKKC